MKFSHIAAFAAALGVAAAGCHDQTNPAAPPSAPPAAAGQMSSAPAPVSATTPIAAPAKIVVYVLNPKAAGDQDMLRPQKVSLRHPKEPARDAVDALLGAARSPLASGTVLRGLSVDGGVATVDFSQSPINETGGESGQSTAMNALAMTLGQFPEISSYQVSVKGVLVKAFGEFTTDGPMDVIRPGAEVAAKGTGQ